ncbi:uroporphyrinogen-III C-methyltransferase [Acidobacteria bacterium AH-259-A15]|nr:uroporphyrinogen-III C-methyltransferase [Acidobacteria bacterium AH-259-A15]
MRVLPSKIGKVYLVGAGPGDPELLTLKGARCLQAADVVIYDRLVDPRILDLASVAAERIFVGKKGGHYSFPQQKINELLARHARRGHQVVRLKGGDPLLLGRGGEEALYLAQEDIPFEVVPGVTSAVAVPASAGIPITHRDLSSSVTIVTGHQTADSESSVRWDRLARSADTLIVLMPLRNLRHIVSQLILNGRPLDTPAALIESGTLEIQRQVIAPLRSIVAKSAEAGIKSPALLVVGKVVHLSQFLAQSYQFSGSGQSPSVVLGAKKSS